MELKRSRSSQIDIAEYMKTAPDMMDEKRWPYWQILQI
jgi:hypothetical protein